jgi:hypothetical protein
MVGIILTIIGLGVLLASWYNICYYRAMRERIALRSWATRAPTPEMAERWLRAVSLVSLREHKWELLLGRNPLRIYPIEMVRDYVARDAEAAYDPILQG